LFIDDEIEYREYFCPGCGLLLQGDFCRPEDTDFQDIHLEKQADD
jgi:acetone carboxylase gamma subunit